MLFPRFIQGELPSLAREIFAAFGTDNDFSCVHDFLDPSQMGTWRRLCESPDPRQLPSPEGKEWGPLVEAISGAISLGEVDATEWGTRLEWERDVTMIFQKYLQLRSENMGRKSRGMFESLGYRAVLERPGAILGLVSQIMLAEGPSSAALDSHIAHSPQFLQFFRFCQAPAALRNIILAPPLSSSSPASRSTSQPSTASPSASPLLPTTTSSLLLSPATPPLRISSSTTFNQFEQLETTADSPHIVRLVPPRFCSPDRCSGIEPLYENYQRVDRLMQEIFAIGMKSSSLSSLSQVIWRAREVAISRMLRKVKSLKCGTSAEKKQLVASTEAACRDTLSEFGISTNDAAQEAERTLYLLASNLRYLNEIVFGEKRVPCVCSLSHLTPVLAELKDAVDSEYLNIVKQAHLQAAALPTVSSASFRELEQFVRDGKMVADCWRGDWREKVGKVLKLVEAPFNDYIINNHAMAAPFFSRLVTVISSAQLLEEIGSFSTESLDGPTPEFATFAGLPGINALVNSSAAGYTTSSIIAKLRGDVQATSQKLSETTAALDSYRLATLIDPTNFEARLNSAAVRLQLADHDLQSMQWSRAIYDCSAALYYGSTSFKAYYRRGYALAYLEMWKEAILDFERALLLEPGNVLLELCLAAAKRKSVV